ncbi:MAG: glycosyltransferase [Patescibacteria group bacterium]|mgnify:CR=1 FL=1
MKIALAHDFLTQLGGAERVLKELHEIFPDAPVYTLFFDEKKTYGKFAGWDIRASFLQKLPKFFSYKWYLPLLPTAVSYLDLTGFDVVISDASALIKGIKVSPGAKHICYCHTPTRYLWQERNDYVKNLTYPKLVKIVVQPCLSLLKKWDWSVAQKVDVFIANSQEVRGRIEKYYQRDSEVIYPPIDTDFFTPASQDSSRSYFLAAGRLEPYKKIDLVIKAFTRLKILLKVAGTGSLSKKLRESAGPNIEFLGRVGDEELRELYRGAKAFVFPALEDAGMMILEATACGTPVIAYKAGGALEFVEEGITGEFFTEQNANSLINVIEKFDPAKYRTEALVAKARQFDKKVFREKIQQVIAKLK